ncbi:hypothetical protein M3Y99_01310000 [Aphelenchoides fujianensis]|nr:hypothetical protein M3Y99_01310000 [Aphelenchoides fujianensis]
MKRSETRLAEQQLQASGLHPLDHPFLSFQIESLKQKKQEMAAEIAALEQQKRAGEAAVVNAKEAFVEEQKKLAAGIAEAAAAEMRVLTNEARDKLD